MTTLNRREAITRMVAAGIAMPALLQRPAPVTGKWLTINGNKVYYEERGQGIPIVMSPGGQNRLETLRPLAEKLAAKYHVITWDRANLGHSDIVFKGARDLDLWSDQQAELVKQLNIRPAYFVGASSRKPHRLRHGIAVPRPRQRLVRVSRHRRRDDG